MRRWGAAPQEYVDDLVQDTFLKLCADKCRRIYQFSLEHPEAVEAYVKTVAVNVAHDFFKAHRSKKRGSGETLQMLDHVESKASFGGEEAIQREVLLREIELCLQRCSEGTSQTRDQLIFWLHYRQGMSAQAISCLPAVGLTVKGVESALLRLTRMVREQLATSPDDLGNKLNAGTKGLGPAKSY